MGGNKSCLMPEDFYYGFYLEKVNERTPQNLFFRPILPVIFPELLQMTKSVRTQTSRVRISSDGMRVGMGLLSNKNRRLYPGG